MNKARPKDSLENIVHIWRKIKNIKNKNGRKYRPFQ